MLNDNTSIRIFSEINPDTVLCHFIQVGKSSVKVIVVTAPR